MSSSMWGYMFLLLGIMAAALLLLFGNINTKNEDEYYALKEVTQNAMLDAVDDVAYSAGISYETVNQNTDKIKCPSGQAGTIRIVTERFIESFARRYAEVASSSKDYKIKFYNIMECPPRVSVEVITQENYSWVKRLFTRQNSNSVDTENTDIVNRITAILETR